MPTLEELAAASKSPKVVLSGDSAPSRPDEHGDSTPSGAANQADGVGVVDDKDQLDQLPPESQATSTPTSAATSAGGFKLGNLKIGSAGSNPGGNAEGVGPVCGQPTVPAAESVNISRESANGDRSDDSNKPSGPAGLSLVDIAGLDESTGQGIALAEIDPEHEGGYLDQIPANAPERELPEGLDAQQQAFVKSIDSIYKLHAEPEMFTDMVRKIMSEMQDRPELVKLLAPGGEDSNAMIRGLRQSAGMAQVKKQESKAKRGSGGRTKPPSEMVDSAMATLQGLAGLDTGGFD